MVWLQLLKVVCTFLNSAGNVAWYLDWMPLKQTDPLSSYFLWHSARPPVPRLQNTMITFCDLVFKDPHEENIWNPNKSFPDDFVVPCLCIHHFFSCFPFTARPRSPCLGGLQVCQLKHLNYWLAITRTTLAAIFVKQILRNKKLLLNSQSFTEA